MRKRIFILCIFSLFFLACAKVETTQLAKVKTLNVRNISKNSATSGAIVTEAGTGLLESYGIVWDINPNPTLGSAFRFDIEDQDSLITMNDLQQGLKYFVRAFVITSIGNNYGYELSFKTESGDELIVGGEYGGGIVFYVDETGSSALIATKEDLSEIVPWKINHVDEALVIEAYGDGIGEGKDNTQKIIDNQSVLDGLYAAKVASNYRGGGFDDWYLPSKFELELMFEHRNEIGNFSFSEYHSSTANLDEWWSHYAMNFSNGETCIVLSTHEAKVRPVRYFQKSSNNTAQE